MLYIFNFYYNCNDQKGPESIRFILLAPPLLSSVVVLGLPPHFDLMANLSNFQLLDVLCCFVTIV